MKPWLVESNRRRGLVNVKRDAEICSEYAMGRSAKSLAEAHGLTVKGIQRVLRAKGATDPETALQERNRRQAEASRVLAEALAGWR